MKAQFDSTCVGWPHGGFLLERIISKAKEITIEEFLEACDVDEEIQARFREYPHGYEFYESGLWYFFTWSAIEHFYRTQ